jgi:hypothetical protein
VKSSPQSPRFSFDHLFPWLEAWRVPVEHATNLPQPTADMKSAVLSNPTKPLRVAIEPENIPPELAELRRWITWRWRWSAKSGKWTKKPSRWKQPEAWGTFDRAVLAYTHDPSIDGIGFVLNGNDGWCGVDLDDCRDNGELTAIAKEIIATLDTYTEVSPTRTGVKLICRAKKPAEKCKGVRPVVRHYGRPNPRQHRC